MLIGQRHLPRRTFLQGTGATLALPFLEAMLPAASAQAFTAPPRFVAIFYPQGMAPGYWAPAGTGPLPEIFPDTPADSSMFILKSLEAFRERLVVLSGLWARAFEPPEGTTGSDQFVSAAFLTAHKPRKTTAGDISVGSATIDQTIARTIGQDSLVPSLQITAEDLGAPATSCGEGYSCWYTNSISWESASRPLPMEIRPGVVFERLFGTGSTPAEREVRRLGQLSLLDGIREELSALRQDLGAPDRLRLEQFTNEIREVELRIQQGLQASELASAMDTPVGYPDSYEELIKLHYDMIALAFQADITRVAAVLGARDYSGRTFPLPDNDLFDGGISGGMQGLSRHQENPLTIRRYAILNRYHVYLMSYLAGKLDAIPEGDGTVLDHSLILYGSNMGNSNQNQHSNVPHFLVGGLDGRVAGGRHLAYPHKTVPTGNLLLDILRRFGTEVESQGDSTGLLVGL